MSTVSPVDQDDFSRGGRPKRVGLLFVSAHLRVGAVSRTEDASGAAVGCPQYVESAVLRAFEDASRTREGCFWHRISLPYRRSLFFTPNASENASRTPGSLFEHGAHIPYHRRPSPVPNARQRLVAAAAEPGVHFSRPPLCYRPRCSVDKPFTGTCGGGFIYKEKPSLYDRLGFSCVVPAGHDPATP